MLWQPSETPPSICLMSNFCWWLGCYDNVDATVVRIYAGVGVFWKVTCPIITSSRITLHLLCRNTSWHWSESVFMGCLHGDHLPVKPKWCLHSFVSAGYTRVQNTEEFDIQNHIYPRRCRHTPPINLLLDLGLNLLSATPLAGPASQLSSDKEAGSFGM